MGRRKTNEAVQIEQIQKQPRKDLRKKKGAAMPKRPPLAYALFAADFIREYDRKFPEVAAARWHSMTEKEKSSYIEKAVETRASFEALAESLPAGSESDEEEVPLQAPVDDAGVLDLSVYCRY